MYYVIMYMYMYVCTQIHVQMAHQCSQIVCTCTCTYMAVFSTYTYIVWFTKMLKAKVINCTKLLVLSLQIISSIVTYLYMF